MFVYKFIDTVITVVVVVVVRYMVIVREKENSPCCSLIEVGSSLSFPQMMAL